MIYRAFIDDEDTFFRIEYYLSPNRWIENSFSSDNPIADVCNWSKEIKYMNNSNEKISEEINNLPTNTGGVYMFFVKGTTLPFIENYIVYIGRCRFTATQNIRKRAKEYITDNRPMIKKMFKHWKKHLYYRYYSDIDNTQIDRNEIQLIRALLPPYNEVIPDKMNIQETAPAFN